MSALEIVATTGGIGPQPGVTITNAWDLLSNRTGLSDTLGGELAFAWDGADRLTGPPPPPPGRPSPSATTPPGG